MASASLLTLLVIGSRAADREPLRRWLRGARVRTEAVTIIEVTDADAALLILSSPGADVIVLEVSGGDDESAMIRELRAAAPDIPIVVATDARHESVASHAVQAGAQDYVITDLDDERVFWRAIRHAVDRAALARRRDALLIREHDARLAAEDAREEAERARAKAEMLEHRTSFLSDTSVALSTSLDPNATLASATRLAVPTLGVAASSFITTEDGTLGAVETVIGGVPECGRLLESVRALAARSTPASLLHRARRRGHLTIDHATGVASLGVGSPPAGSEGTGCSRCVLIPLQARDTTLGVLVLALCDQSRPAVATDLALTQAFAARVATALDNACLYETSRRATRTRDHVLGIVSHDLRNPLSAISMCANALRTPADVTTDGRLRLVTTIDEAVGWTQRLLGDLIDVASIEAGRLAMNAQSLDPIRLLARSLDLFEHGAGGGTVHLARDVPEWLPSIDGDELRILQVIGNLVSNARKVTPPNGAIALGARPVTGAVRFFVADTGPGIEPEHRRHIFDWFWRASHERAERGTGLGLAIAKGIVEAHGGRIDVDSLPGAGATFWFTIPRTRVGANAAAPGRGAPRTAGGGAAIGVAARA
jgi:signal transduction histidine kinase/DNA-binding NarL/FixJ family response regulator